MFPSNTEWNLTHTTNLDDFSSLPIAPIYSNTLARTMGSRKEIRGRLNLVLTTCLNNWQDDIAFVALADMDIIRSAQLSLVPCRLSVLESYLKMVSNGNIDLSIGSWQAKGSAPAGSLGEISSTKRSPFSTTTFVGQSSICRSYT